MMIIYEKEKKDRHFKLFELEIHKRIYWWQKKVMIINQKKKK